PELSFAARTHLAFEMANPVATAIRHDPPPGVHPEVFLACVAAAYQWREGATAGARPPVTAPPPFGAPPPPPPPPPSGGPTEDAEPGFVPPT
ncbi:MAG TPA: hypothetical protein VD926_11065, partial [Acidimicrobiales bacterium]|nr:hypothetical protein [Acidimicrobiales bacterium]